MIMELVHDPILLSLKSDDASEEDADTVQNLVDTLTAHKDSCVGMAANMIGSAKRIIAFVDENGQYMVMLNPVIIKAEKSYDTEESCLSLLGGPRKCTRFRSIKVQYQTTEMQTRIKSFKGFTAQIIQHEIDHCCGVLI